MKKMNTREKLLKATLKLISEKGYTGATTREIAREAGVTELTLFRNFGSKERLFEEVLNKYTFLPRLRELLPELQDLKYDEALIKVGIRFIETLKERKSMIKIMQSEVSLAGSKKIRTIYTRFIKEMMQTFARYFASLQEKGIIRPVSPELVASVFFGTLFSYFHREEIVQGGSVPRKDFEKKIREFVDIFINGTI